MTARCAQQEATALIARVRNPQGGRLGMAFTDRR